MQAGFPSPAQDLGAKRIDLTAEPVRHPHSTIGYLPPAVFARQFYQPRRSAH